MPEPRYRALLIGNAVFRRDPQNLPKLYGPRADVDALCEALADPESGMFAAEDVEPLIDRNLQNLREELHRFFIEDATRDDVLLLYYSGHGKLDIQGRLHLCTNDTRVSSLRVTALQYKEDVDALIKESPAAAAVTILDCCHSGAFRGGELKVKATGKGRCVITSAGSGELALDALGPKGTSPFTTALVAGLRFARAESQLTAQDLYRYLETELSPAGNSRPQFYFDGEGQIALARRQTVAVTAGRDLFNEYRVPLTQAASAAAVEPAAKSPSQRPANQGPIDVDLADSLAVQPFDSPLPEPRTHLWNILNEAAASTLPDSDQDLEKTEALCGIVRVAAKLDPKWPLAVVRRLSPGETLQSVVEAMITGLAEVDEGFAREYLDNLGLSNPEHAGEASLALIDTYPELEFLNSLDLSSPVHVGASLALIDSLAEHKQDEAKDLMREAIAMSLELREGSQAARALVRVMRMLAESSRGPHLGGRPRSVLHSAARAIAVPKQDIGGRLERALGDLVAREKDPARRASLLADIAIRLSQFNPELAHGYFRVNGRFLPRTAFDAVPTAEIVVVAAAMLGTDPKSTYRLFEIAELRCRTEEDWTEYFHALIQLLQTSPDPSPTMADHLVTAVERTIDSIPADECRHLRSAAANLVATAPASAGRLLRLDPDEDRMRMGLIETAKEAAGVDAVAARNMAVAAERLVLSILNESKQADGLVDLVEAFAAVDPEHALRLLRSLLEGSFPQSLALKRVSRVFTKVFPDRIEPLISEFASRSDSSMSYLYGGIAEIDPARAIQLAAPMPDSSYKESVFAQAAASMALSAPGEAAQIALGIGDSFTRAHTLKKLVDIIATNDPDEAAVLARRIPTEPNCESAPIRAERLAFEMAPGPERTQALLAVAKATMQRQS
ncbi:caspase family protein [Glycomyces luteolus]|uniref:Caspase family protein n=1 Tax=Glycomyces luteolus TaxID=2670330 RepID=A0A9X3PAA9_9ACTN|nr:caspase family protein [Glycomyces luteolus]MDA1360481.1 caspase family protein [Glycomyces luteolus]